MVSLYGKAQHFRWSSLLPPKVEVLCWAIITRYERQNSLPVLVNRNSQEYCSEKNLCRSISAKFLSKFGEAALYLHWEQVSRLTALCSAFPECINLHLCAFNLIEAGLVKSWSFAVVGKRGCTEDCSQTALAPWAAEGCPATASPATFHQDKGEVFLCHHPHFLVLTFNPLPW